jgi:hypothetical protein
VVFDGIAVFAMSVDERRRGEVDEMQEIGGLGITWSTKHGLA